MRLSTQRLLARLRVGREGPVLCRMCGGTLGRARVLVRDGRVRLEGFDGTARVRWTAEDELAFEHVRPGDCERK